MLTLTLKRLKPNESNASTILLDRRHENLEQASKAKREEQLKLYNFLRPSKREQLQGKIEYLQDVKKDLQKALAAKEISLDRNVGAAETRYQVARSQSAEIANSRANEGKAMPAAIHHKDELARINDIAVDNTDAHLCAMSMNR